MIAFIIRIRGVDQVGTTMITFMERYAGELRANGGKLMLSGVSQNVLDQILRTETTESVPEDSIFMATDTLGESSRAAMSAAHNWLAKTPIVENLERSKPVEPTSDVDDIRDV